MRNYKGTLIIKDKNIVERHSKSGGCILMPLSSKPAFIFKRRYRLNKTAADVMLFLIKRRTFEELCDYLKSLYPEDNAKKMKAGLKTLLSELETEGLINVERENSTPQQQ